MEVACDGTRFLCATISGNNRSSIHTFQCIPPPRRVTRGAVQHDDASSQRLVTHPVRSGAKTMLGILSFIFAYTSMYLCWPKLPHYSDGKAPSRSPSCQTERTFHHDNCPFLSDASHAISIQHGGLAWCAYSHVDLRTIRAHSSQSLR